MSRGRAAQLRALHISEAGNSALLEAGTALPDDVALWLGELTLLEGLPFDVIVPDARMLPPESLRFFFLDDNWIDALRDGALSLVDLSGQDHSMLNLHRSDIKQIVRRSASTARRRARLRSGARPVPSAGPAEASTTSRPSTDDSAATKPWTGLLLRSAVVSDLPGLQVAGYRDTAGTDKLELLRITRLAPTVLLVIFAGIVAQVQIAKPAQGLHFGVIEAAENSTSSVVYLRGLGGALPAGAQPPGNPSVPVPMRAGAPDVIDIVGLQAAVAAGIVNAYQSASPPQTPPQTPPVPPGAFGLQLVTAPEVQSFVPGASLRASTDVAPAASARPVGPVSVADLRRVVDGE